MLRVALKDLMARKRRLVTTGIAIVLGIAFLTGTQLLSQRLTDSIQELIGDVWEGIDVVVRSPDAQETPFGPPIRSPLPIDVIDQVTGIEGVRTAEGFVTSTGPELIDRDGKVVGVAIGPPTLVFNWIADETLRTGKLTEGRGPDAPDEIVLDFATAESMDVALGDEITLATTLEGGTEKFELVGIVGLGEAGDRSTGARPMFFTTDTAMRLINQPEKYTFIAVAAEDGLTQAELADRIAERIDQQVLTGDAFTEENAEQISQFVGVLGQFVTVFGYIALFVAVFIIYNTFSIIITQRTRETALLRAIGARRRQVLGATMLEAVVVGLFAGILGLALGLALAVALIAVLGNFFTIAGGAPTLTPGIVATALGVGLGVTVLSAFIPALRSSKIPPIAAISEVAQDRSDLSVSRRIWGVILLLGGAGLIGAGLAEASTNPLLLVGLGAAGVLLSVAVILGPMIATPVSRLLARMLGSSGSITSRLAGENAARSPKRTAATAAALTIGVTLVVVIAIVASSIRATFDSTISDSVRADYVVATASITSFGAIPRDLGARIEELDEVRAASPARFGFIRLLDDAGRAAASEPGETPEGIFGLPESAPPGQDDFVLGIDPTSWFDVIDNGELVGSPAALTEGTMAVNRNYADQRGWRLGDRIPVYFGATGQTELEVAVLFERNLGQGSIYLPLATFSANTLPSFDIDFQIYVQAVDGADLDVLQTRLEGLTDDLPTVLVQDLNEFVAAQTAPLDVIIAIVYALLALAILIALIGIANTLSLSVLERTRELGLLRAVGMSRRQLRRMVRTEAAIIAVFGTLIGLVIGILFSIALTIAISASEPDLFTYDLPVLQLVLITILAALAGVLAAWLPAKRAGDLDVLDAISTV